MLGAVLFHVDVSARHGFRPADTGGLPAFHHHDPCRRLCAPMASVRKAEMRRCIAAVSSGYPVPCTQRAALNCWKCFIQVMGIFSDAAITFNCLALRHASPQDREVMLHTLLQRFTDAARLQHLLAIIVPAVQAIQRRFQHQTRWHAQCALKRIDSLSADPLRTKDHQNPAAIRPDGERSAKIDTALISPTAKQSRNNHIFAFLFTIVPDR